MNRFTLLLLSALVTLAFAVVGCGSSSNEDSATADATPAVDDPHAGHNHAPGEGHGDPADPATQGALAVSEYTTQHDANAVYTLADVPNQGNYLKLNLQGLDDDQVNATVHRLRTEKCGCANCGEYTLDECMINRPACGTGLGKARGVIREEKARTE